MNILITNVHSVRNSGDFVLLEVTLREVTAAFPGAKITVAINDPDGYVRIEDESIVGSFNYWFKSNAGEKGTWRPSRLLLAPCLLGQALLTALLFRLTGRVQSLPCDAERRRLVRAYLEADLVISCPGNFFLSGSGIGLPLFLAIFSLGFGWLAGKPLYMMQQTIGPLRRRREQLAIRWLMQRIQIILVRDERSLQTLNAIGLVHPYALVLPDAAFLYQGTGNPERFLSTLAHGDRVQRPFVGVTLIDFGVQNRFFHRQEQYEQAIVAALAAFIRTHGGTVFLFPQVCGPSRSEDDRIPGRRIHRWLCDAHVATILVDDIWTSDELTSAYGQMDTLVGTRLHSNIFALTAGTPVIAIAYFYKTYGVMQTLGLSEWVLDINTVDAHQLHAYLERLWKRRSELHRYLAYTMPRVQQEARRACRLIREDFESRQSG